MSGKPSQEQLFSKISSEGYCCFHGYLRLCKARGETAVSMAEWLGMHRYTLYYHYRALKQGKRPCQKISWCLLPVIEVIEEQTKEKGR